MLPDKTISPKGKEIARHQHLEESMEQLINRDILELTLLCSSESRPLRECYDDIVGAFGEDMGATFELGSVSADQRAHRAASCQSGKHGRS